MLAQLVRAMTYYIVESSCCQSYRFQVSVYLGSSSYSLDVAPQQELQLLWMETAMIQSLQVTLGDILMLLLIQ